MILDIPIFDGGLITNADAEDIPKNACTDTNNFDIDVEGKLVKRKGTSTISTISGVNITHIYKWVNSKLPSSDNAYWIVWDKNAYRLLRFDSDWTNQTTIKTFSSSYPTWVEIVPFGNRIRFGFDSNQDPSIYEYIDREYFFGLYQPSAAFNYDTSKPKQMTLTHFDKFSAQANGSCGQGYFYYKIVPVYDGNQEPYLPDTYAKYYNTSSAGMIMMKAQFTTTDFDKRITALNIYRHFSADDLDAPVYYLQRSIPTNTKSTNDDIKAKYDDTYIGGKRIINLGTTSSDDFSIINTWANASQFGTHAADYIKISIGGTLFSYTTNASESGNHFRYLGANVLEVTDNLPSNQWGTEVTLTMSNVNASTSGSETREIYCGDRTIYLGSWDWENNEIAGWHAYIEGTGNSDRMVTASRGTMIQVTSAMSTIELADVTLANGYRWAVSGSTVTLIFDDNNEPVSRSHNLTTDKNDVRYRHAKYINGRYYQGNVVLDPSDVSEEHDDFIMFSEVQQPDVTPVTNYIQLRDAQGGQIMGLRQVGEHLVVFMESGLYRLYVPSTDPRNFVLKESEENFGCVSSKSIVQVGNFVFFASKDNIYAMTSSYEVVPCSKSIRDIWQAATNKQLTHGIYDPIKHRVLYVFGDDESDVYALDTEKFMQGGKEVWNRYDFAHTDHELEAFGIDEDLQVYLFHNSLDS